MEFSIDCAGNRFGNSEYSVHCGIPNTATARRAEGLHFGADMVKASTI
jgi:hypothetical protein